MKKIFIIAGEPSGDLHGANLVKALFSQNADLTIKGWGGELMQEQGVEVLMHYKKLAFMGFAEVIANLRTILKNFEICKSQIKDFKPDAVVFIDYPGFNLRMAKFVKKLGIKTFYYISPQIWAWKQNRVYTIKKYVDEVYSIMPFEKDFYKKFDVDINFVGHPLIDAINNLSHSDELPEITSDKPILAILPGSRKQEISKMLPVMLKSAKKFDSHQIVIAGAPSIEKEFYLKYLNNFIDYPLIFGKTYSILYKAHTAMVTSGTATLETALFNIPQVVCYKGGAISIAIARMLIKVKYISLVNLIMDKEVVKELIQDEMNEKMLTSEIQKIISGEGRTQMLNQYKVLIEKLGGGGASEITASLMLKTLATS